MNLTKEILQKKGFSTPNKKEFKNYYKKIIFGVGYRLEFYYEPKINLLSMYCVNSQKQITKKAEKELPSLEVIDFDKAINQFIKDVNKTFKKRFKKL